MGRRLLRRAGEGRALPLRRAAGPALLRVQATSSRACSTSPARSSDRRTGRWTRPPSGTRRAGVRRHRRAFVRRPRRKVAGPHLPRPAPARRQVQARRAVHARRRRQAGHQLPEGALVCNFPQARRPDGARRRRTLFHEFGHLMHHVLGGTPAGRRIAASRTEQDFVEAPSQMFEEWALGPGRARRPSPGTCKTGEPIPAELVQQLRAADEFGKGLDVRQPDVLRRDRLQLHDREPRGLDTTEVVAELQAGTRRSRTSRAPTSRRRSGTSTATRRCTTRTCGRS